MFKKLTNPDVFIGSTLLYETSTPSPSTSSIAPNTSSSTPSTSSSQPSNSSSGSSSSSNTSTPSTSGMGKCGCGKTAVKESIFLSNPARHKDNLNKIIMEYMDMKDISTITQVTSLNEAEQNTFLVSLTTKLYNFIVDKVDSIDYGDIPNTKGDIRKLPKYKQIRECIELLHDIFVQYKEDPAPVQVIDNALSNLENNSHLFMSGYAGDISIVKMVYETTALGVISALGFMISVCIEYVKTPRKEGLTIVLNRTGIRKVKDHIMYENLIKFNDSCKNGDLEKALNPLISNKVKNLEPTSILLGLKVIVANGVLVAAIIPFLRQMVYFFYASRVRMSTYLDAQADLLEMNANELSNNPNINTVDEKTRVINRQLKIAKLFHVTANKIAIEDRNAENKATSDLKEDNKKYKMDEVDSNPANSTISGPLF